ncbi:hypothetical protein D3C75_753610 [compost metagenome]
MASTPFINSGVVIIDNVTVTSSSGIWSPLNSFCDEAVENSTKANSPPWLSTPENCKRSELRKPKNHDRPYNTPAFTATSTTTPRTTQKRWV